MSGLVMKRIPVPVSFMIVMMAVIELFIFFGAWAVSVDAANHEREFSIAIGNSASLGVNPLPSQANAQTSTDAGQGVESAAESWWGSSLLLACPLH